MLQSNNFDYNNQNRYSYISGSFKNNKHKKSIYFKIAIFILIFFIISALVTTMFIVNYQSYLLKNSKDNNEKIENINKGNGNDAINSKEDTYDENNLKVVYKTDNSGNKVDETSYFSYYPASFEYPQIDGLSKSSVQSNINNKIKNTTLNQYTDEDKNNSAIKYIKVKAEVIANFSNVLSLKITKTIILNNNKEEDNNSSFIGLDFNLETGEQIQFSDLFIDDTNIKEVLKEKAYEYLAISNYGVEGNVIDLNTITYNIIIDNELLKVMSAYTFNEKFEFCFDNSIIQLFIGEKYIQIDMREITDKIAIYNRYKNVENLYNNKYIGTKGIYVFSKFNSEDYLYTNINKESDNLFIDIRIILSDDLEETAAIKKIEETYKTAIESKIDELKNDMSQNQDYSLVYACIINIGKDNEDETKVIATSTIKTLEMSKEYFLNDFIGYIIDCMRIENTDITTIKYQVAEEEKTIIVENNDEQKATFVKATGAIYIEEIVENVNTISNETTNNIGNTINNNTNTENNTVVINKTNTTNVTNINNINTTNNTNTNFNSSNTNTNTNTHSNRVIVIND